MIHLFHHLPQPLTHPYFAYSNLLTRGLSEDTVATGEPGKNKLLHWTPSGFGYERDFIF